MLPFQYTNRRFQIYWRPESHEDTEETWIFDTFRVEPLENTLAFIVDVLFYRPSHRKLGN